MAAAKASTQGFIAQKYLERPFLYDHRKFDLRVWACVASDLGSPSGLRIFVYREGYARTSSEAFTLPAPPTHEPIDEAAVARERLVHLTNYCMQVHGERCGAHEEGNCVSFNDLANSNPSINFREKVLPRLYSLVCDAVLASRKELLLGLREHGSGRNVCALLGYDFMITSSGQPFLIECNANPLLAAQNPWHDLLVTRMVDDYVSLINTQYFDHDPIAEQPRPSLDGVHVDDFGGSGFVLLAGRPTDAHPQPMFELTTIGGVQCIVRSEQEKRDAAAVEEPPPPAPPPAVAEVSSPSMSSPPPPYVVLSPEGSPSSGKLKLHLASSAIMHDAANAQARATERRLAAMRFAATHRAKAAASMPPTGVRTTR